MMEVRNNEVDEYGKGESKGKGIKGEEVKS